MTILVILLVSGSLRHNGVREQLGLGPWLGGRIESTQSIFQSTLPELERTRPYGTYLSVTHGGREDARQCQTSFLINLSNAPSTPTTDSAEGMPHPTVPEVLSTCEPGVH